MPGRTVKLVVIGPSGCGKTSLRGQYISGRFATNYRATIGTDFITKQLPSPTHSSSEDVVTLQIWDTAGQERFSSLSAAFFRGADAVMLVFDVNQPQSLVDLQRWWNEFKDRAPVPQAEEANFCVVVVGNKTDLVESSKRAGKRVISEEEARKFIRELIPIPHATLPASPTSPGLPDVLDLTSIPFHLPTLTAMQAESVSTSSLSSTATALPPVALLHSPLDRNPSSTSSHNPDNQNKYGTMTTTNTSFTSIYHTPSSSLFREHDQPTQHSTISTPTTARPTFRDHPRSPYGSSRESSTGANNPRRHRTSGTQEDSSTEYLDFEFEYVTPRSSPSGTIASRHSARENARSPLRSLGPSVSSLTTIKPQYHNLRYGFDSEQGDLRMIRSIATEDPLTPSASPPSPPTLTASLMATLTHPGPAPLPMARKPDVGPKLFFTSAKLGGQSVGDAFEYVARRVVEQLEWDERLMEFEDGVSAPDLERTFAERQRYRDRTGILNIGETLKVQLRSTFTNASCCKI